MSEMIAIVTGTRDTAGGAVPVSAVRVALARTLAQATQRARHLTVFHGDAPGVDALADSWVHLMRGLGWRDVLRCEKFPAHWEELGRRAGPVRNQLMVDTARVARLRSTSVVGIAFPAAHGSTGTPDCMRRMAEAEIPTAVLPWETWEDHAAIARVIDEMFTKVRTP